MNLTATTLFTIVTGVGQCAANAIAATPTPKLARVCLLVPGSVAWDLCDCGQLAQTITGAYPSANFPQAAEDQRTAPCGPNLLVATVQISVVRCVHGVDQNGHPPTCAALLGDSLTLESDRFTLRRSVTCCLRDLKNNYTIMDFVVAGDETIGPQGQCAGVQLTYRIGVTAVCC